MERLSTWDYIMASFGLFAVLGGLIAGAGAAGYLVYLAIRAVT